MIDERKEFGKKLIEIREMKGLRQGWPSRDYKFDKVVNINRRAKYL